MNKILLLSFYTLCFLCCSPVIHLELNSEFKETGMNNTLIFIPDGSCVSSYRVIDNNIEYDIGVYKNTIIFISTSDKDFTVNGLRVNDHMPASMLNRDIGFRSGWGYYVEIVSGWYAGFDYGKRPTIDSPILFFFKYDFDGHIVDYDKLYKEEKDKIEDLRSIAVATP